ncbi:serine hydrolase domain-containing protein [Brevundimonas sp. NPDC003935]|uniref:serine hydrolase domain-containing protein n=1 Tax=unclassified Brevundimonas TaxID=2622653 RepID=UPI0036CFDCED
MSRMIKGLALAVLMTATAGSHAAAADSAAASAPASQAQIAPLSSARQAEIDRYVLAEMARQRAPGLAVGVYRHGVPVLMKGYGLADVEWGAPVASDTRMQTGSLGKQFVAAAILKLAEEGRVDLDAPVARYFPEAPRGWADVTVANLLSHTSGIGAYDGDKLTGPGGAFDYRKDFTEDQLAAAIAALPTEFEPGTRWSYNNANYVLLGILIRRVTGQPYGDYLNAVFFAPLGMSATRVISDADIIPRRASGYEMRDGALRNQAWVSPTFNATADGTIYSTVEDMARWDRALYGDALLSPESIAKMWTPFVLKDGKPNAQGYGFGWNINMLNGQRRIMHNGAWQGFTSTMTRYPDLGLTVVVFANLDSSYGRPDLIARVVAGLVEPEVMPSLSPALPDDPARAERLRAFLDRAAAGEDLTQDFSPGSGYRPDPGHARDLTAALPEGWRDAPMTLVRDLSRPDGGGRYSYRVGPVGNTRLFTVALAPSGRVAGYGVAADPDNR